jgi:hypothetical protein
VALEGVQAQQLGFMAVMREFLARTERGVAAGG